MRELFYETVLGISSSLEFYGVHWSSMELF